MHNLYDQFRQLIPDPPLQAGTVVSVGKQISRHWYMGYERNLSALGGNWQLVYSLAQRFKVRAQAGEDNAIDFIWQWRWR